MWSASVHPAHPVVTAIAVPAAKVVTVARVVTATARVAIADLAVKVATADPATDR